MERVKTFAFNDNVIEKIADAIVTDIAPGTADLSRVCVVFGGKRPHLFLQKSLARRLGSVFFPPAFFSMDEFVDHIAAREKPYARADELQCCFRLYRLAREKIPALLQHRNTFSSFLPWAREILNFIEQLDLQNIPSGPLRTIELSASIGYEVPESINSLLGSITVLREDFHAMLEREGKATRGMAYRAAALASATTNLPEFDTIVFCNFFYLHTTETDVLKNLFNKGKAVLVFQKDSAEWPVLERLGADLGISLATAPSTAPAGPAVSIYSAFDTHSQVCCAREILSRLPAGENTVIVLPDPDALIPLLSEIAGSAREMNVSLGYPLRRSSIYSLFRLISDAQISRRSHGYYSREYLRALSHPLVKNLCLHPGRDSAVTRVLAHKIEELLTGITASDIGGMLFTSLEQIENCTELYRSCLVTLGSMDIPITTGELKATLEALHRLLFRSWESLPDFTAFCGAAEQLITTVIDKSPVENYPLNLLVCEKILDMISSIRQGGLETETFASEELFRIFLSDIENKTISFTGSPLKGLQILGLFETRCLNFENVIVLDLNEKKLPNLTIYEPLIPREVMLGLGLDRIEKEDEIQRYQFFRLIGGAQRAFLVFLGAEAGEKSRFLEEMLWEQQKKSGKLETDIPKAAFTVKIQPEKKAAPKTPEMIAYLRTKTYSASSLNTYLHCPLRFYFHYVLGLEEKTDLLEETEAADIGTFVHDLLEEAFTPFIGSKPRIDKEFTSRFFALFEEHFARVFTRKMRSDAFMLKELLTLRLRRFLAADAARDVKEIVCLEQERRDTVALEQGAFNFVYRIDRIDRMGDDSILVLDYKTGSNDVKPASPETITRRGFDRQALKKNLKSIQMPMYLYFVNRRLPCSALNAGLYSLRNASITLMLKRGELDDPAASSELFLNCLQSIINEILAPDIRFTPDETNFQYCAICPYACACR